MPETPNNPNGQKNDQNGRGPKRIQIRFNLSWFYLLLVLGIIWMFFNKSDTPAQKIEWAEVQSMVLNGDVKDPLHTKPQ